MSVIRVGLISRDGEYGIRDVWARADCQIHQGTKSFPHRKVSWLDVLRWGRVEVHVRTHWEFAAAAVLHAESSENFDDVFGLVEHQLIRCSLDIDAEDVFEWSEVVDSLCLIQRRLVALLDLLWRILSFSCSVFPDCNCRTDALCVSLWVGCIR